ncbi:uncharacterized protein LOC124482057 [Hypomesus transpacificus]|uniref:uncharacterized protein LOC124482057 n=1 Tax=Hypomesus transpacificus TaxID=137520 RepID=UPI001F083026|nr:uncharacterized protein LOC124482057 [Hypomesus transpacificus]
MNLLLKGLQSELMRLQEHSQQVLLRFDGHYSGQQGLLRRRGVVSNHHSLHAEIQDIQQVNTGGLVCPTHTATLLTNLPTECIYIDIYCLLCEYIFLHFNLRLQLGVLEDVSSPVYVGQSSNSQRDDLQHIIHRIKSAEVTHMLHSNYPDWDSVDPLERSHPYSQQQQASIKQQLVNVYVISLSLLVIVHFIRYILVTGLRTLLRLIEKRDSLRFSRDVPSTGTSVIPSARVTAFCVQAVRDKCSFRTSVTITACQ